MTDKLQEFIDAMHSHGIGPVNPAEILADDKRHRYQVEGDRARTLNGEYCLRVDDDGFAVGWFKSYKTMPDAVSWHSRSHKKRSSAEEKAEWAARVAADKARREAEDAAMRERARAECARLWAEGELRSGVPYLEKRGLGEWRAMQWMDFDRMDEALLVPAYKGGEIVGLQKIYSDGGKYFVPGSDLDGSWCWIGDEGTGQVAVCEGYATGVSVHLATGWRVAVAFNAGNLVKVARAIGTGVIVCSDEDLFTPHPKHRSMLPEVLPERDATEWAEWREKGWLLNTGRDAGMAAAAAVGGAQVLYPAEGGDWDDVRQRDGLETVRDRLLGAVAMARDPEPERDWDEYEPDVVGVSYEDVHPLDAIKPLGYNKGVFYFFPSACGQIMEYTATSLAQPANLAAMADWVFWDQLYNLDGKMAPKQIAHLASSDLMRECRTKRIFSMDNLRGVGVWMDRGRVVVNTGTELHVDGKKMKPQEFDGEAVYEAGNEAFQMGADPLKNAEASELREVCKAFNFRDPMMGELLAGSIVLGPISGVLDWRPHWILTGEAGSGKSTLMDHVVKPMIGKIGLFYNGGSSEAGIRKKIGLSARPVCMDEAESETKRAKDNMDALLSLARDSSSGASRTNAVSDVNIRSCFFLAAINPRITQTPDKQRFSTLELLRDTSPGAQQRWKSLELKIHEVITPEYSRRMFARTLTNIETLLANIRTFSLVAARVLGSARAGDQIGALLAASYSLTSTRLADEAFAEEWMNKQNWSFHDAAGDLPENEKFMATLLTLRVRYDKDGQGRESSVGSLIRASMDKHSLTHAESVFALKDIGIRVIGDRLVVANSSPNLLKLLRDTIWSDWRRVLMLFDGADNYENKTVSFGSVKCKATSIPLAGLLEDEVVQSVEVEQEVTW